MKNPQLEIVLARHSMMPTMMEILCSVGISVLILEALRLIG